MYNISYLSVHLCSSLFHSLLLPSLSYHLYEASILFSLCSFCCLGIIASGGAQGLFMAVQSGITLGGLRVHMECQGSSSTW